MGACAKASGSGVPPRVPRGVGAENAAFSTVYFGGFFPGGLAAYGRGAMSAKNVSKMCNFVHKLCKNVHFLAQKRHFCAIFARGRGDFLAGPKIAILAFSGVARDARKWRPFLTSRFS